MIAGSTGDTVLLEHPRAAELPDLLADRPDHARLAERLGAPRPHELVAELVTAGVLVESGEAAVPGSHPAGIEPQEVGDGGNGGARTADERQPQDSPPPRRVVLTRSGMEFPGIERPARWIHTHLRWLWTTILGRVGLGLVTVCGIVALCAGHPAGPSVSAHPWVDALLGLAIVWVASAAHELAHAVALVGYGRRPRRAGFGFYWGGVSFYVDSTEALTLPRRARVTQALVGLGVDTISTSLLAVTAQLVSDAHGPVLLYAVAWRTALLGALAIGMNLLPILQVDGHWALADYLDEPDLAPRSRAALASTISRWPSTRRSSAEGSTGRRRDRAARHDRMATAGGTPAAPPNDSEPSPAPVPRWMAVYGAASLLGGTAALTVAIVVWWSAAGDLATALFTGNPAEIGLGLVLVGPITASILISVLGVALDLIPQASPTSGPATRDG